MYIVYGLEIKDCSDPYVTASERALRIVEMGVRPDSFLVDLIPIRVFYISAMSSIWLICFKLNTSLSGFLVPASSDRPVNGVEKLITRSTRLLLK